MFVLRNQLTTHKHNNLNIVQTNLTYFLQYYEEYSHRMQNCCNYLLPLLFNVSEL